MNDTGSVKRVKDTLFDNSYSNESSDSVVSSDSNINSYSRGKSGVRINLV